MWNLNERELDYIQSHFGDSGGSIKLLLRLYQEEDRSLELEITEENETDTGWLTTYSAATLEPLGDGRSRCKLTEFGEDLAGFLWVRLSDRAVNLGVPSPQYLWMLWQDSMSRAVGRAMVRHEFERNNAMKGTAT